MNIRARTGSRLTSPWSGAGLSSIGFARLASEAATTQEGFRQMAIDCNFADVVAKRRAGPAAASIDRLAGDGAIGLA